MLTPRFHRRETRAFTRYMAISGSHANREISALVKSLQDLRLCANNAITKAPETRNLTVAKIINAMEQSTTHKKQEFRAKLAGFPMVFTPAFAIPILTDLVDEINADIQTTEREPAYAAVQEAYREWEAVNRDK
jgi:hypothetical protein